MIGALKRFIPINELGPGHRVKVNGQAHTIAKVERADDGHHWHVSVVGSDRYVVYPPTARFTRVTPQDR